MTDNKKYNVSNLYVLIPSIVTDIRLEHTILMKRETKKLIVVQKSSNLTIGEYNKQDMCFQSIENDLLVNKALDYDFEYGNSYVGVFERDYMLLQNYLWNMQINDLNNKNLCNHILKICPEYSYDELIALLKLLKKESKYYPNKIKKYKYK